MDINEPLQHYASPYYDPVKTHEYYMRTRELKGRRSTTKLNDEGKKVWAYTKNEISGKKKEKVKEEQEKRKQKSRHRTDQPCLRFFWKVMLVGYVTAESQNVQPRRARTNM